MIEAGQAHRERGRGVALDQDDVGLRLGKDAGHSIENAGRQAFERLIGDHDVEIEINGNSEGVHDLIE